MIPPGHTVCYRCQGDRKEAGEPTWWSRWRVYPRSCFGHIVQGAVAASPMVAVMMKWSLQAFAVAVVILLVWMWFYTSYQGLSGARKAVNRKKTDTMGLDVIDFLIGTMPVLGIAFILALRATEGGQ